MNTQLIVNFLTAMNMFSEESIGRIDRFLVEGARVELNMVQKYGLVFITVFVPKKVKDHFDLESSQALELFYAQYKSSIDANRSNQTIYKGFDAVLTALVLSYLNRLKQSNNSL